ncbi:MAG: hypothetical protein ACJAUV_001457 [Flavobacteriales bacterium]|jgi:hypothetical protein
MIMKKIEKKYFPIIELLEGKLFLESIKNEYKGFITAANPMVLNPKILFIGINPGAGAYDELNSTKKNSDKKTNPKYPKTLFSDNKITQIDWLKDGNSRGECIKKSWKPYKWHDRNKKVNNVFVKRLIEFFFSYYDINNQSDFSEIENKINSEIFYYNVYPIATKSTKELGFILKKIVSKQIILNENQMNTLKNLKNFFRQRAIDLIEHIQPEIIICLGSHAYRDLTNSSQSISLKASIIKYETKFRKNDQKKYPVYIVARNGNWEEKIKNLGTHLKAL